MASELVERLDAAASELLAWLRQGEVSSEELLEVLSGTRAVRGKLDTVQALAAAGVAGSRNHGDGGAHVLAESTGMSRSDARSRVRTITAVGAMPAVRDAVEDGRMPVANAGRLADALDETSAGEVESDGELLAKAESLSPERFAKEVKRWTAERQADGGEAQFRRLRARRAVRFWNGDDGMVHLHGQFDPVTGRRIRNRLNRDAHRLLDADNKHARAGADVGNEQARVGGAVGNEQARVAAGEEQARARAGGVGNEQARAGGVDNEHARAGGGVGKGHSGGGGARSFTQCMADALEAMTSRTAGGGEPFADIALVARLDSETETLMASTADGDPLPVGVIERLAGESSWFGLVLSAKGVPMWKGRNVRRVTTSQFQALMALYGGCAGCGEPDEDKLNAHHMDPFARGGGTDLDNLMPLCWGCHNKIHDHGWQVVGAGDGKYTIRPPDRIHHGAARLPDTAPLFAPSEPPDDAAPRPAGGSLGGARAGPTGPQAARAALRRARAARHDAQAARV